MALALASLSPAWGQAAGPRLPPSCKTPVDAAGHEKLTGWVASLQEAAKTSFKLIVAECRQPLQAIAGHLVISPDVETWAQEAAEFSIAHELGHLAAGDVGYLQREIDTALRGTSSPEQVRKALQKLAERIGPDVKKRELAADRYAFELMTKLGKDAARAASLAFAHAAYEGAGPFHPSVDERMTALEALKSR